MSASRPKRSATIERRTGETEVRLSLALEGTGAGTRETGVGFLDHMLDLLARHGRIDLDVKVSGDLQTGAHHTAEDTAIVLGQALDDALGDRTGIVRYGSATVPMDEARASCAIDISGRPFTAFEARAPAGLDGRLRARADRGVLPRARQRGQAHAAPARRGRHQRPPHDRGGLQGVRARAAPGGRDRPHRDRRAEHEGNADGMSPLIDEPVEIAVVDYGMGNRRSVEKALEHVGARASVSADPERAARRRRPGRARRGRLSARDGEPARARPRRAAARARRGRHARARHLPGPAAGLRLLERAGRRRGPGHRRRRGARAAGRRAEAPAHRLERGALRQNATRR